MVKEQWDWEIRPGAEPIFKTIPELFRYKDLLNSLIKKELTASYQQSIIGVAWLFFQPLLTTIFYFIVFGRIVKVDTGGIPPLLFYMLGSILWSFFNDCLVGTMYTFMHQAHIFQKIYFPRLIVPLAIVINHSIRFSIQFLLFLFLYFGWSFIYGGLSISFSILLIPFLFLQLLMLAMGIGLFISVFISKYRDIEFVVQFLVRLFMFVSPVIYPASMVPKEYQTIYWLNPLTPIFEIIRSLFFIHQSFEVSRIMPSIIFTLVIFLYGLVVFQKREKIVMDVV